MFIEDLQTYAEQELHQMRHFYLGVEHLVVAMLGMDGSILARYVRAQGYTPTYVTELIRRKIGKGARQRLWAGILRTPRLDRVLRAAEERARNPQNVSERELLDALLDEPDSMPLVVLQMLDIDLDDLRQFAHKVKGTGALPARVHIDSPHAVPLNEDQREVMNRMFTRYQSIRVERQLLGGYTEASLFVITPIHHDGRRDASVVVKIDHAEAVQDEADRYLRHVRDTLPGSSARLVDRPVILDDRPIGGIKYTLVGGETEAPRDLRAMLHEWTPQQIGEWLQNRLYPTFGKIWWEQRDEYRFLVWHEYDRLFPPILTLEYVPRDQVPPEALTIRQPINRARLLGIDYGDIVIIENFAVRKTKLDSDTLQLAVGTEGSGALAYKIEIRGVSESKDTYYRGEVIESIAGRVWSTRDDHLNHAVHALAPDFDVESEYIPLSPDQSRRCPNPILHYERLMDLQITGAMSKIHGDMHLGNMMIGPEGTPFLIDFDKVREGHSVFDWVSLEISILMELVVPLGGSTWDDARRIATLLQTLNAGRPLPAEIQNDEPLYNALRLIAQVRQIASRTLAAPGIWTEYYVSLALTSLRAVLFRSSHNDEQHPARRLMLLVSGLALNELKLWQSSALAETQYPDDETDFLNISPSTGS